MSSKVERPTLQGQRIKTRKRDEKEKFDPGAFRDSIFQGLQEILNQKSVSAQSFFFKNILLLNQNVILKKKQKKIC